MFSGIGGSEILLVLLVVLILFGSKRIPEFARAMGKATREVRKALNQIRDEVDTATTIEPPDGDPPKAG
ncbi:twin-arginine translocase TatA/TatE family subunit [Candidatus Eisenbacteria bacterium]|uniref:Sec-independent protein translocase protein TatA n=1 Tax=Eiseniibacteriota bacterium TaxID=2212470 RepID=A0ABV6YP07_UNCEI